VEERDLTVDHLQINGALLYVLSAIELIQRTHEISNGTCCGSCFASYTFMAESPHKVDCQAMATLVGLESLAAQLRKDKGT